MYYNLYCTGKVMGPKPWVWRSSWVISLTTWWPPGTRPGPPLPRRTWQTSPRQISRHLKGVLTWEVHISQGLGLSRTRGRTWFRPSLHWMILHILSYGTSSLENNLYVILKRGNWEYKMWYDMIRVRVDALKISLGQIYVLTIEIKRKIYFLVDK